MSGLVIRPMTIDDLAVVLTIEQASSSQPWTEKIFRDELGEATRTYVVGVLDDAVAGFCGLMLGYEEGHITNVAVDPSLRRGGVASRLLLHVTRIAIARSMSAMTLEVRVSNEAARGLYARFGYGPAGARPHYYADNHEDALIYWAHDIDTADYGLRLAAISERLDAAAAAANTHSVVSDEVLS